MRVRIAPAARLRHALLLPILVATSLAAARVAGAAEVSVHARLDRAQLAVGDSGDLAVQVDGAQDAAAPAIANAGGLAVRYVGPSSQLTIVNGRTSASVTHHFSISAAQPGTFTIGPITVDYDGRRYDAGSLTVQVVAGAGAQGGRPAARQGPGPEQLRLELASPRTRAYLHERIPVTLTLTVGAVQVSDVHYPTIGGDGFALEPLRDPVQRREQTAQGIVQVVEFPSVLTPLRAGALVVGPATLELSIAVRGGRDPFFDRFLGGDPFAGRRPFTVRSEPLNLDVLPLPDTGKPADFSGAVGRFELQVEASPRELNAGDPVTVTTTIRGDGNLEGIAPPLVAESDALKVYPVQTMPQPGGTAVPAAPAVRARAAFEQVVIPQRAGTVTLPPIRFSYFDPEAAAYRSLAGAPVVLTVTAPAPAAPEPPVGAIAPAPAATAAPETLGRDIVFIKDAPGDLTALGARRYRAPAFWAMQLVPAAVWALVVLYDRRRHRLRIDPGLARFTTAGRTARRAIAAAETTLRAGDRTGFYDQLAHALREYLSAKLDLPPGAITADDIAARVRARGVPADVADGLRDLFATCERVRFAPAADGDGDTRQALARAEDLVRTLERARRLTRAPAQVALFVVVALAGALAPVIMLAAGTDTPNTIFFRANALYGEERYAEAAAEYERILASGLESAPLHFNLGNAYFKTGDVGRAVLAYERARRLAPADPDVRANLHFARAGGEDDVPLTQRLLFPLATRVASDTLLLAASVLYALVVLLLVLARLVPASTRAASRAAAAAAVVLTVVATSATYRIATVDLPTYAVVVAPQGATVRFEPSAGGTPHFEAKTGSTVRVLATREGWAQVARPDGTRGWIPAETIATL